MSCAVDSVERGSFVLGLLVFGVANTPLAENRPLNIGRLALASLPCLAMHRSLCWLGVWSTSVRIILVERRPAAAAAAAAATNTISARLHAVLKTFLGLILVRILPILRRPILRLHGVAVDLGEAKCLLLGPYTA
mmetsp:Transcript_148768/g.477803  ORF Transcript_148768/g.477803 Transcript_148768/m.477803 type:complete len:135 (-) Transcript_148768:92-496(-)